MYTIAECRGIMPLPGVRGQRPLILYANKLPAMTIRCTSLVPS